MKCYPDPRGPGTHPPATIKVNKLILFSFISPILCSSLLPCTLIYKYLCLYSSFSSFILIFSIFFVSSSFPTKLIFSSSFLLCFLSFVSLFIAVLHFYSFILSIPRFFFYSPSSIFFFLYMLFSPPLCPYLLLYCTVCLYFIHLFCLYSLFSYPSSIFYFPNKTDFLFLLFSPPLCLFFFSLFCHYSSFSKFYLH